MWLSQVLRLFEDWRLFLSVVTTIIKSPCMLLLIIEFISLSAEPLICSSWFMSLTTTSLNMLSVTYEVNLTRCLRFMGLMVMNPIAMVLLLPFLITLVRAIITTWLNCCHVISFIRS